MEGVMSKAPQSIVITGASSGIGRALALELAAPGVSLGLLGRQEAKLTEVAALCQAKGAVVQVGCVDVTDATGLALWFKGFDEVYPIDWVLANAGVTASIGPDGNLEKLAEAFKEMLPWRYGNQMRAAQKVDKRFLVPNTPFSTITVNRNFRTAAHYDPANMDDGFANICVFSNSDSYRGAYLVFPEIGYACNIRPGDLLFVNNMAGLHGNTELILDDPNAERISIIAFFHEGMLTLGSWEYEQTRKAFVEQCRNDVNHPYYKPRFNGVYPGMWTDKAWYDFCEAKLGRAELLKMHPEAEQSSIESFFG